MITRIITALIGLPIFLGLLYKGEYYTQILVLAMVYAGISEIVNIFNIKNKSIVLSLFLFSAITIFPPEFLLPFETAMFFMLTLFIIYIKDFTHNNDENKEKFITTIKGLFIYFYVTLSFYHLVLLRNMDDGFRYIFFMFIIIWVTDSFAYFTGMAFGKNKLAPSISPKKTIEGSVGGSLSALIISLLINKCFAIFPEVSIWILAIIILFLTVISQLGDLFESSIKRIYNVKDSGKILPGHGGVLDRFDSTIFVAPVFYILLKFLIL
ncbi:MAG: phosphatidate cytidylyltransferase [Clostridia bacterium]|nr:phosphatidate cytidylyltransferase [Clostridia bacterium]